MSNMIFCCHGDANGALLLPPPLQTGGFYIIYQRSLRILIIWLFMSEWLRRSRFCLYSHEFLNDVIHYTPLKKIHLSPQKSQWLYKNFIISRCGSHHAEPIENYLVPRLEPRNFVSKAGSGFVHFFIYCIVSAESYSTWKTPWHPSPHKPFKGWRWFFTEKKEVGVASPKMLDYRWKFQINCGSTPII